MLPYLLTFSISEVFFLVADFFQKKRADRKCFFCILLGIIPLCILASLRDTSIGIDVSFYALPTFLAAKKMTITKYFSIYAKEPLYYMMVYICSNYFKSFQSLLFLNELIILIPTVVTIYNYRDKLSISLAMLVYMFVFYNGSYCYMRQYIACSMVLLATYYILNNKMKKGIVLFSLAFGFHSSSILIMIMILLCCKFFKTKRSKFSFLVIICLFLMFYSYFGPLLMNVGLLSEEYYTRFLGTVEISSNYAELLLYTFMLLPFFMLGNKESNKFKDEYLLIALLMILFIVASALLSKYIYRFSMYFKYFIVIMLPVSVHEKFKKAYNRRALALYAVSIAVVHFIWFVTIINTEKTYPYLFLK